MIYIDKLLEEQKHLVMENSQRKWIRIRFNSTLKTDVNDIISINKSIMKNVTVFNFLK